MSKVALVTGATRGIGKQIAITLAKEGYDIAINYRKDNEELQKVYVMDIMMNFSKINMNYEIRNQIFDYLRFFTFFCFCE